MIDIERDLKALIVQHLNAGRPDSELLSQIGAAINQVRTERQTRSEAASLRARLRYHSFVSPTGQLYRVSVSDLSTFCIEFRLNEAKMLELSNGGRNGLAEYKQWRRGRGRNALLNGEPYYTIPDPDPSLDDEPTSPERRLFRPKPTPPSTNHRPCISYLPPSERNS